MPWFLEFEGSDYETVYSNFAWDLPSDYNIARDTVRKHDPDAPALLLTDGAGGRKALSFGALDSWSNQLANGLSTLGLSRGDRVGVMLGQVPETLVVHLACWKLGLTTVPLSVLFGESALRHRLQDSQAQVLVADDDVADIATVVASSCSSLEHVFTVGEQPQSPGADTLASLCAGESSDVEIVPASPTDTAIRVYTSGTTGRATGVSHSQAIWVSYCSAFRMYFEHTSSRPEDAIYWTPSDWAWIGGLGTVLFPAWHYGRPVVARPMRSFDAAATYEILETFEVTHASFPPTALRMLADADVSPQAYDLALEVIVSGSEPLTDDVIAWRDAVLCDVVLNEGYGQTETGNTISNCHSWFPLRQGSMGKPVPGYDVVVVDQESREPLPPDTLGEIAVCRSDNPGVSSNIGRTDTSDHSEWHYTGDLARYDDDGYYWFVGRADDLIVTAGYRVAPREVEGVLVTHAAVSAAAVVGIPDDRRGEAIAAVVALRDDWAGSDVLKGELRTLVRDELSKYAYPRQIRFVDQLPTTTTGKTDTGALHRLFDSDV